MIPEVQIPPARTAMLSSMLAESPHLDWVALLGWIAQQGSQAWNILADIRSGMTTPDAIGKYGQGLASAIEQLAHLLGIRTWQAGQQSTMHTEAPRQRNVGPPGTNFTLLLVVNDTITLVWPLEENSCKAVLNAFTPLTATKVAAYGNDFGPAGPSGNFVIVKGTVNGQSASG